MIVGKVQKGSVKPADLLTLIRMVTETETKKHPVSCSSADRNTLLMRGVRGEERSDGGWSWQKGFSNSPE